MPDGIDTQVNQGTGDQGNQGQGAQGATGTQAPGWIAGLPDDLKGNETFTGFKTVGDFAKHHLETAGKITELEGKLGTAIFKPGDGATEEEMAAYRAAIGVPESADKYAFDRPTMPEGVPYNEALETWFRNTAFKRGIPSDMAQGLYQDYMEFGQAFLMKQAEARTKVLDDGMKAVKDAWGNKFDENVAVAKRTAEKIGLTDEGMKAFLSEHNLENDPRLLTWILKIAPAYLDDGAPPGRSAGETKTKEGMDYKIPNPPPAY